jgi:hypothetical protein
MGRIIKITLLADLASCIVVLVIVTIRESLGLGLYVGFYTFWNVLIPTLVAVLIYEFVKRRTILKFDVLTILFQTIILTMLFTAGLFVWAGAEAAIFKTFNWTNTESVFDTEFSGFMTVVFSEALVIPTLDLYFRKRELSRTS